VICHHGRCRIAAPEQARPALRQPESRTRLHRDLARPNHRRQPAL